MRSLKIKGVIVRNNTTITNGFSEDTIRAKNDLYNTPPEAVDYLLKLESFSNDIVEPMCGMGNISEELKKNGYNVYSYDKFDYGYGETGVDIFETKEYDIPCDIISNPPYKNIHKYIIQALKLTNQKVAFLCKITLLETERRYKNVFKDNPPARIYVFVKRIYCYKDEQDRIKNSKQSSVCYAWFVWDKTYDGDTIIKWIDNTGD